MKKEKFEYLLQSLKDRVAACQEHLDAIPNTSDLLNLTIAQARDIRQFCVEEYETMTKIAMVDLYHILGMGNLSAVQRNQFCAQMTEYLKFRPLITNLAKNFDSINALPLNITKTHFHLLGLCHLTLAVKYQGSKITEVDDQDADMGIEDTSSIEDYTGLKPLNKVSQGLTGKAIPFALNGNCITFKKDKMNDFISIIRSLYNLKTMNTDKLTSCAINGGSYLGIQWTKSCDGICTGFVNLNNLQCFQKILSKQ